MTYAFAFLAGFIAFPITAFGYWYYTEATQYLRDERTQPWKGK